MSESIKQQIKEYWDAVPCGTGGINYPAGSLLYYEEIARRKDYWDYPVEKFVEIEKLKGLRVLEVGCGVGTDLVKLAQAGAIVTGIDLSPKSVAMGKENLHLHGYQGVVIESDAENIPYKDNVFDVAISWGCLHHTPNTEKAISEIYRVLKTDGEIYIMLYHKPSLVCFQMWLLHGLFALKPFKSMDDILCNHHESIGTRAYTIKDAVNLFSRFRNITVKSIITAYDLRYTRSKHLPMLVSCIIPSCLGWNMVVRGRK